MQKSIQRIYIVGAPGTGKSTLAKHISSLLAIPHIEADMIAQPGSFETITPLAKRKRHVHRLASQPAWIAEGYYVYWTKEFLDKADLIIYLHRSAFVTIPTVFLRNFYNKLNGVNKYRLLDQIKLPLWLLKYHFLMRNQENPSDSLMSRRKTLQVLRRYEHKVITLNAFKDTDTLLASMWGKDFFSQPQNGLSMWVALIGKLTILTSYITS